MSEKHENHQLVKGLLELKRREDRGALAALRTGLGKSPGQAPRMFPLVARYLPDGASTGPYVQAIFLTASLFAKHPEHATVGNLGRSLRQSVTKKHGEDGVSARLTAALDADPEDLAGHLTGLVSLCESASIPVDWNQFLWDTRDLLADDEDRRNKTRLNWAKGFWGAPASDSTETESKDNQK